MRVGDSRCAAYNRGLPANTTTMESAQASVLCQNEPQLDFKSVRQLCADDMRLVDELIRKSLDSNVVLIRQIAEYIIGSGGKRLRPMLAVLAARACGYSGTQHIKLAAIIEFIHTATLLHDDVVDESELRRGKESAHAVWGNAASVLVGDFLYSRAFQMMVEIDSMQVMDILSNATNQIAEGEVEQLLNMHDPEVSQERYFRVIEKKTAKLFEAACQLGAVIARRPGLESQVASYGRELGIAFQVMDDVLDYTAEASIMGKNRGDDLAEGKSTLPLILCRKALDSVQRDAVDQAIRAGDISKLQWISQAISDTGALAATRQLAEERSRAALAALEGLENSPWKSALVTLAVYSVNRDY
jgi:octaprenyl-diphosphate synthase